MAIESENRRGKRVRENAEVSSFLVQLQLDSCLHHHSNARFVVIQQGVGLPCKFGVKVLGIYPTLVTGARGQR